MTTTARARAADVVLAGTNALADASRLRLTALCGEAAVEAARLTRFGRDVDQAARSLDTDAPDVLAPAADLPDAVARIYRAAIGDVRVDRVHVAGLVSAE